MKKIIIAVDGYSSCGKSTMAKQLAKEIGYIYVDSGAMYRAVTLLALRAKLFSTDGKIQEKQLKALLPKMQISFKYNAETGMPNTYLNNENVEKEIRTMVVSSHVSPIAVLSEVRAALVAQQQQMGKEKGIIMDGRDIGTTVFPNAEMKVFVTASPEIRAQRRFDELKSNGQNASFDDVLKNVENRDYIDSHREISPLRQASDAVVLDNSHLTREEQLNWLLNLYHQRTTE
ncbi:MAG: (d)CMP kinase [Bacteroidaceae bacterium]|jgi:cytidylate kinase|nr:(d)CMP kinase [Bacteroidaceae bacterium]